MFNSSNFIPFLLLSNALKTNVFEPFAVSREVRILPTIYVLELIIDNRVIKGFFPNRLSFTTVPVVSTLLISKLPSDDFSSV